MEINNLWLTEEYLLSLGYFKITDDGQYGVYKNKHWIVISRSYGNLPEEYRKLTFNRDSKYGVLLSVGADWDTRYSVKNVSIYNKEEFETILNCSI